MTTKVCTKCGVEKDMGEFHRCARAKSGLQSKCKACMSAYYQTRAGELIKRSADRRRSLSKEQRALEREKWVARHPGMVALRAKKFRAANPASAYRGARARNKRASDQLKDHIVMARIRKLNPDLRGIDIPQSIINLKREQLALHRVVSKAKKLLKDKT